jgi:hypothetical protein
MTLRVFSPLIGATWPAWPARPIWAVFKAKKAAEQARDAAQQVKERIAHLDTVAAVSAAITTLEEIKILHRTRAWDRVLA